MKLSKMLLFLFGCILPVYADDLCQLVEKDFLTLQHEDSDATWYVQGKHDKLLLKKASDHYSQHIKEMLNVGQKSIPHIIHFIWIGPRPYPISSKPYMKQWIAMHPGWRVKLWTDRPRNPPVKGVEVVSLDGYLPSDLQSVCDRSNNWSEKSDLLRFYILFREGGVYADHDASSTRSFTPLVDNYHFFAALEPAHLPINNYALTVGTSIIGSQKGHPALKRALDFIKDEWDAIENTYAYADEESRYSAITDRTYFGITYGVVNEPSFFESRKNILLPARFFYPKKANHEGEFAFHIYSGSWKQPDLVDKDVRVMLKQLSLSFTKMSIQVMILCMLMLLQIIGVYYVFKRLV